jgi:hypothetical protein
MPKIQEYLPETQGAGPAGGVSPNIDQVTMFGRGIESFGANVGEAAHALNQRQTNAEVSEASAAATDQKAQMLQDITDATNDKTLDVDKVKESLDNWTSEQSDNYSTAGGKDYFNKQASRVAAAVLHSAQKGATVVTYNRTRDDAQRVNNTNNGLIDKDPTQLQHVLDDDVLRYGALQEGGHITPAQLSTIKNESDAQHVIAAIKGYAQGNGAPPGASGADTAETILKSGAFDRYLSEPQRAELTQFIKKTRNDESRDAALNDETSKRAIDAKDTKWYDANWAAIQSGGKTHKQITADQVAGLISGKMADHASDILEKYTKGGIQVEPINRNRVLNDVLTGKNPNLVEEAARGNIHPDDIKTFGNLINETPAGRVAMVNRKNGLDAVKKQLNADDSGFLKDPQGPTKFANFSNALMQKEQELISEKKQPSDLYNPKSPNYFFSKENVDTFRSGNTLRDAANAKTSTTTSRFISTTTTSPKIQREPGKSLTPQQMRDFLKGSK